MPFRGEAAPRADPITEAKAMPVRSGSGLTAMAPNATIAPHSTGGKDAVPNREHLGKVGK